MTGLEIAIIGIAGQFPGAANVKEFWENLKNGVESLAFLTDEELETTGVPPGSITDPAYVKSVGGVLEGKEYFDAAFFGYTPQEAEVLNPAVRFFSQCAWHALEDAAYNPFDGDLFTGVYGGASRDFMWQAGTILSGRGDVLGDFTTGLLTDETNVCNRVSYNFNLKGPAIFIQTACSTSLVAIHMACQGLLNGECDMALAGGATVPVGGSRGYLYREGMFYSPDGHCRAFDAKAKGVVRGEGVGVVVLKRLEPAIQDGDNIYALIKGTAINNDGLRKVGYTAPSVVGQSEAVKIAHQVAEVEPGSVTYIETHGTGTVLGDPVEVQALARAFDTEKRNYCALGAVKTNVGHLDSAAGVAGFIKTVLALKHKQIPPSLHFETPNPHIDFEGSPFYVNTRLREWKRSNEDHPLRAGVSAFGIGGTNAHAVLEEWNEAAAEPANAPYHLLLLSARNETALHQMTENLARHLKENPALQPADAAYTLQVGRKGFRFRRKMVCRNLPEAIDALSAPDGRRIQSFTTPTDDENPKVIFVFPGQGSQYVNMGLGLYRTEPVFREAVDRCFEILRSLTLHYEYDIKDTLYPGKNPLPTLPDISHIENSQPVIFIMEYALGCLLIEWGIVPYGMIGYSFGEYAAACIAGVFSLEDVLKLLVARGELFSRVPGGAMLSVPLPAEEIEPLLPDEPTLTIGLDNGSTCVVTGTGEAVELFEGEMKKRVVSCMRLNIYNPGHSPMMTPLLGEFQQLVSGIPLNPPRIPFISTVTGDWITPGEAVSPAYWAEQLSKTVRFAKGIRTLMAEGDGLFLEVGPGWGMGTVVKREIAEMKKERSKEGHKQAHRLVRLVRNQTKSSKTPDRDANAVEDVRYLLDNIGVLWLLGVPVDWAAYHRGKKRKRVSMPAYPFEKQRFWQLAEDIAADNFEGLNGNVKGFRTGAQWVPKEEPGLPAKEEEVNEADGLYQLYERPMLSNVYEAPATEMERFLTRTWETFFGIRPIGVTDELFDLGGDSLKAVNLFAIIQEELHVSIPLIQFFDRPTIRQLALFLDDAVEKTPHPVVNTLEPVEEKEYYSLSPAQMRLYILYRLEPGGMSYNIPMTLTLEGELNARRLEESFVHLVRRHESFRTSFLQVNEEPCQRVHAAEEVDFKVEYYDLDSAANRENENERDIIRAFRRPFDLLCPPLFRVGLIKIAERKHILVLDVHHIVADGLSIHLLIGEFYVLYDGLTLPGLKLRYRDFCDWLDRGTKATQGDRETFWLERFRGDIPVLELPYDFPRPPVQRFEGGVTWFELSPGLSAKLKELASREGVTLFIAMLAIFNIVLSGLSGQRDIVVGTPVAGRRHPDLQTVVGMFVNTLALRNHPEPDMTFREFLKPVKQHTLESFDHQEYPFEDLVDRVTVNRDVSRNPLFDVMLAQDNMESAGQYSGEEPEEQEDAVETGSLEAVYYPFEANISRFDLSFHMSDAADGLSISIEYATALFKKETVQRFFNYTRKIIREVTERPGILLKHIDILEENEKQEILDMSQGKEEDIPTHESIHGLFETQATQYPDRVALVRKGEGAVSYKELDRRADQLAGVLRENGVGNGTIVAVMVERSVGLIVSLLAVLKAGAVCLPIDSEDPEERVDYMLRDSGANVSVRWLNGLMVRRLDGFSEPTDKPTNLSCILYPSGSTSKPKAVILEHRNLLNLLYYQIRHTTIDFSRVLQFAAIGFHVSFQEIFSTLLFGGELTLINSEILADIPRLFRIIEENNVRSLFLPPSFLKFIMGDEQHRGLLPGGVRHIVAAGEPVIVNHVFRSYLQSNGIYLYNQYGPTETHVVTSLTIDPGGEIPALPGIGVPVSNTSITILGSGDQLQPVGVAGELVIGGTQVGRGYLNCPELTAERFLNKTYRTGDLAAWQSDGNLRFLGRLDSQVKVRGIRIELSGIEARLLEHRAVKETVVIAHKKELCAYVVFSSETVSIPELKGYLSDSLPDYMVPVYFVSLETLPLKTNRKPDRSALPEPDPQKDHGHRPPRNPIEEQLLDIWSGILQLNKDTIGIEDNFFQLGGHSLNATLLTTKVHKGFDVALPLVEVFKSPTIEGLARYIQSAVTERYQTIHPAEKREYYPLSSAQKRLYIIHYVEPSNTAYNMPQSIPLPEKADTQSIREAFQRLIQRHESLRTSFVMIDGHPVQRVHDHAEFKIEFCGRGEPMCSPSHGNMNSNKGSHGGLPLHACDFVRPFDLSHEPLLRAEVVETGTSGHLLMVDIHHIITDGVSQGILMTDFMALYRDENPEPLTLHYKDFSQWQNSETQQARIRSQENYWLKELSGQLPILNLPDIKPEPGESEDSGGQVSFVLRGEVLNSLKALENEMEVTRLMLLMAVYIVLLSRYFNRQELVTGTLIAGRRHADLEKIIGFFVNMLPIRTVAAKTLPFRDYLMQVREKAVNAYDNQEYPFEELVAQLDIPRIPGRNPLVEAVFLLNEAATGNAGENPSADSIQYAHFDLMLHASNHPKAVKMVFEYNASRFKKETVSDFANYYMEILEQIIANPTIQLGEIKISHGFVKTRTDWLEDDEEDWNLGV